MKRKAEEDRKIHSFFAKTSNSKTEHGNEAGEMNDAERKEAVEMSASKRDKVQSEMEHVPIETTPIRPESEMSKNTHVVSHCPLGLSI